MQMRSFWGCRFILKHIERVRDALAWTLRKCVYKVWTWLFIYLNYVREVASVIAIYSNFLNNGLKFLPLKQKRSVSLLTNRMFLMDFQYPKLVWVLYRHVSRMNTILCMSSPNMTVDSVLNYGSYCRPWFTYGSCKQGLKFISKINGLVSFR